MKKTVVFILLVVNYLSAQGQKNSYFDFSYFRGSIIKHAPDIGHLITGHPEGFLIGYTIMTDGSKEWHEAYNFPEYGFSFLYQDFKNQHLGETYALNAYYSFYFLRRKIQFRVSQGLALAGNPYDREQNFKNNAFGSRFLSTNSFLLQYQSKRIFNKLGFQIGLHFTHYSNGRIQFPNRGINTYNLAVGVRYHLDDGPVIIRDTVFSRESVKEPFRYTLVFRGGVNESIVVGSGQKPFYHPGFIVDKRVSRKSAWQLGAELFLTTSLKEYIRFSSVAYPEEEPLDPNTDYKRVGIFLGHELFINKLSVETQLGYYVYKPFKHDIDLYQRVGLKYYFNNRFFSVVSLKSHGARAEAVELGVGIRM